MYIGTTSVFIRRLNRSLAVVAFLSLFLISLLTQAQERAVKEQIETKTYSLAGDWSFQIDPYKKGGGQQWWKPEFNTAQWDSISVPGVWDVYDQYHDYTGDAWYRTSFSTGSDWDGKGARLVFDSVYHDSEIWLNGSKLGESQLGFIPFSFQIEDVLKKQGENTLVVRVNNRVKRGAVWNWGGIRRPVYIEITPQTRIERVHVTATPDLEQGSAHIGVKTRVSSSIDSSQVGIDLNILRKGVVVASHSLDKQRVVAGEMTEIDSELELSPELVALWHFNEPNLYSIEAILRLEGQEIHLEKDRFGIRKVEVKGEQLFLNGEAVRLVGFNMVPEDRFDGNALPLSRIKEDVDILKSLNANFARLSGPTLPKEYLDYLDEVGFLLVEEVGLWGKDRLVDPDHPLPKLWLERMVDDHYNHPSVVAWSVGNEIGDLHKNPKAIEYVKTATEHARKLDPTRLAVYISYSADFQANDPTSFSDIVMFNKYNDHEERLKVVRGYQPGKPIFFSEIGRQLDSEDPNLSVMDPEEMMGGLKKYPYLVGTSLFAFSDYRSNWRDEKATWTTPLSENRSWGVVTAFRTPKRSFKRVQNFFAPVESMDVSRKSTGHEVSIEPRSINSFPSFTLKGYRIVWTGRDLDGNTISAGSVSLPTIKPDSSVSTYTIDHGKGFAKFSAHLIDPAGYVVLSKHDDYKAPKAPVIRSVHSSIDTILVLFEKSAIADEHQLILTDQDGNKMVSDTSINDFIEMPELQPNKSYKVELVAINNAGKSKATSAAGNVATDNDELPPVIWETSAKQDAFFIGFSAHRKDFRYEIEYGLEAGVYKRRHLIETHGATRIPAIKEGEKHYFRMRRLVTGSVDSDWTDEYSVQLPGKDGLSAPQDAYVIPTEDGVILGLTPVDRASGYRVTISGENTEQVVDTRLAQSGFIVLDGLSLDDSQNVNYTVSSLDNSQQPGPAVTIKKLSD